MVDLEKIGDYLGLMAQSLGRGMRAVFGSQNARRLKRMRPLVELINQRESWAQALSQEEMQAQTGAWRKQLEDGVKMDAILPDAFAMVRETAIRTLG